MPIEPIPRRAARITAVDAMNRIALAMALGLATAGPAAAAGAFTGNDLVQWQIDEEKAPTSYGAGLYAGYIAGVADSWRGMEFCPPSGTTMRQMKAITTKYLREKPERWNSAGDTLVREAISTAFPCVKSK